MTLTEKYLAYWPVLAGGVCFLALGLWLWLVGERAMERSPKPLSWVREYRRPGFPLGAQALKPGPLPRLALAAVTAAALGLAALYAMCSGKAAYGVWTFEVFHSARILAMAVCTLGAAAMYLTLWLLFGGGLPALLGGLLFAASPVHDHEAVCLLACCLLLLLLYLRAEGPGLASELLYPAAVLFLLAATVLRPAVLWLIPCLPAVHLYKLLSRLHREEGTGGRWVLSIALALAAWALGLLLAAVLRRLLLFQLPLRFLPRLMEGNRIGTALRELWRQASGSLFPRLGRYLMLDLLLDAPLFGLGLWGCCSAAGMVWKRRSVRGLLALLVLGVTGLLWLLSARYLLTLGLCLTAGCMLKNCEIGGKRMQAGAVCLLGLCCSVAFAFAAWAQPLPIALLIRMF